MKNVKKAINLEIIDIIANCNLLIVECDLYFDLNPKNVKNLIEQEILRQFKKMEVEKALNNNPKM